jgi:hypothetical protein
LLQAAVVEQQQYPWRQMTSLPGCFLPLAMMRVVVSCAFPGLCG